MAAKASVNIVTLGCPKNVVDSEKISGNLNSTFKVYHNHHKNTDIVFINTCGFINDAKEESIDTILQYVEAKKKGLIKKIYVMGCLVERYKEELMKEIPGLDGVLNFSELPQLVEKLSAHRFDFFAHRQISTASHFAYLKISEGCDRTCSFCAIPFIRGKNISFPMEKLIDEAQSLAASGVKELIVVAQDSTYYGLDIYKKRKLAELLNKLADIKQFRWIRLHYAYPAGFPMDVAEVIQGRDNVCKYIDMPLQHISDRLLHSMKRAMDAKSTIKLLENIRKTVPGIYFRTAFIIGYPGESAEDFELLYRFVKEQRFERMGVFGYSAEEGTEAAHLTGKVHAATIKYRIKRLMMLQHDISLENNTRLIGSSMNVVIDSEEKDHFVGRTPYDSPEIDNEVLIEKTDKLSIGNFYTVKIKSADAYDLHASLIH